MRIITNRMNHHHTMTILSPSTAVMIKDRATLTMMIDPSSNLMILTALILIRNLGILKGGMEINLHTRHQVLHL